MRILVVGSEGQMGRTIRKLLIDAGHQVFSYDRRGEILIPQEYQRSLDTVFLCTPLNQTLQYLKKYANRFTLIEMSSVKHPLLPYRKRMISIHPFFGPNSVHDDKSIAFIDDISRDGALDLLSVLLPQCRFISMNAEEHDDAMVDSLVFPYLLSEIARILISKRTPLTNSGRRLVDFARMNKDMNPEVVREIISTNPGTGLALKKLSTIVMALEKKYLPP